MTATNAQKKLTKAGFNVEEIRPGFFHASKEACRYVVEYFRNGRDSENITCICVRRHDARHDSQSDYHAGSFADTITQAIRWATM